MSLFHFCKIKKRNFNIFSSRKKMVRQKSRKTVEELYTTAPPPPSLTTTRFDENFYQNSKLSKNQKANDKADVCVHSNVACRKKPKVLGGSIDKKDEKTFINEERLLGRNKKTEVMTPFLSEQKQIGDNEKDEDTEEFFGMIKDTVEKAVHKAVSDVFHRNFRDLSAKIDELGERVQANETHLEKMQTEMTNKIVHYGEENSRHFRYLCMKSEYDKMFYQHQNVMTAVPLDSRPNTVNPYPQQLAPPSEPNPQPVYQNQIIQPPSQLPQQNQQSNFMSKFSKNCTMPLQCNCQNPICGGFSCARKSKVSVSTKSSSEMDIREVKDLLEQLQKFYDQHSHDKDRKIAERSNENLNVQDQDDSADGDEDDSSDNMSSPSIEENLGAGGDA